MYERDRKQLETDNIIEFYMTMTVITIIIITSS